MVMHPQSHQIDPAADAAALLRRLGFAILFVVLPLIAFISRRAIVVLTPVGLSLLILSRVLEMPLAKILHASGHVLKNLLGAAGGGLLLWAALSLLWSPDSSEAADKLLNIVQALVVCFLGILVLPERVKASNLYLTGIGVTAAVSVALALCATQTYVISEPAVFERAMVGLAIFIWPAVAWFESRRRTGQAFGLLIATAVAIVWSQIWFLQIGFAVGLVVYALTCWAPAFTNLCLAWLTALVLGAAPILVMLIYPSALMMLADGQALHDSIVAWQALVLSEPNKFLIGHGLDSMPLAQTTQGIAIEIWFELGAIGALLAACVMFFAVRRLRGYACGAAGSARLEPGASAAVACVIILASLGASTAFPWRVMTLAVLIISFAAIARGQFRTHRPKARWPLPVPIKKLGLQLNNADSPELAQNESLANLTRALQQTTKQ